MGIATLTNVAKSQHTPEAVFQNTPISEQHTQPMDLKGCSMMGLKLAGVGAEICPVCGGDGQIKKNQPRGVTITESFGVTCYGCNGRGVA